MLLFLFKCGSLSICLSIKNKDKSFSSNISKTNEPIELKFTHNIRVGPRCVLDIFFRGRFTSPPKAAIHESKARKPSLGGSRRLVLYKLLLQQYEKCIFQLFSLQEKIENLIFLHNRKRYSEGNLPFTLNWVRDKHSWPWYSTPFIFGMT